MLGFVNALPLLQVDKTPTSGVCFRPRFTPSMRADRSSKKAAPLTFAVDMKGKAVWSLRPGTPDDVPAIVSLGGDVGRIGEALLSAMVTGDADGSCVVCEASVKGSKAGDGYVGKVLGATVSDIAAGVRDPEVGFESGLVKRADMLACEVSKVMQDAEDVRKTLLLGTLKMLKGADVLTATKCVADGDDESLRLYRDLGFKTTVQGAPVTKGSKAKQTVLTVSLPTINPDPKKKIS